MNIKDAYRYAKTIDGWIYEIFRIIENKKFKITENHLKSKGHKDMSDEEKDTTPENLYDISVIDAVYLVESLLKEKAILNTNIEKSKSCTKTSWKEDNVELDLDTAIEFNKSVRNFIGQLLSLNNLKSNKTQIQGKDYCFNVEGNQVVYTYPVEKNIEVTFDKNIIRSKYRKITEDADMVSQLIEEIMIKDIVKFEPKYKIHMTLDEVIETYLHPEKEI